MFFFLPNPSVFPNHCKSKLEKDLASLLKDSVHSLNDEQYRYLVHLLITVNKASESIHQLKSIHHNNQELINDLDLLLVTAGQCYTNQKNNQQEKQSLRNQFTKLHIQSLPKERSSPYITLEFCAQVMVASSFLLGVLALTIVLGSTASLGIAAFAVVGILICAFFGTLYCYGAYAQGRYLLNRQEEDIEALVNALAPKEDVTQENASTFSDSCNISPSSTF